MYFIMSYCQVSLYTLISIYFSSTNMHIMSPVWAQQGYTCICSHIHTLVMLICTQFCVGSVWIMVGVCDWQIRLLQPFSSQCVFGGYYVGMKSGKAAHHLEANEGGLTSCYTCTRSHMISTDCTSTWAAFSLNFCNKPSQHCWKHTHAHTHSALSPACQMSLRLNAAVLSCQRVLSLQNSQHARLPTDSPLYFTASSCLHAFVFRRACRHTAWQGRCKFVTHLHQLSRWWMPNYSLVFLQDQSALLL